MKKWRMAGITAGIIMTLIAAGCGNDNSNAEGFSESVNYTITGIESGAGIMQATDKALEDYDELSGWSLIPSSSGPMAIALGNAIRDEDPIIITGWTPHWMFAKYDLKYLEDPKGSYGESEAIHTIARKDLDKDMPEVNKLLDQFQWSTEDIETVMLESSEDGDTKKAARNWVDNNPDKVEEWTNGVEEGSGQAVRLVYSESETDIAATNVVQLILDDLGYETTVTSVDIAVMWQSIALGEADAMVSGWLPTTHGSLYEAYEDQLVDLGPNLEDAKTGLVVPSYIVADSIEDLKPKE